jgi:two-component system invasion response regulator UvrY
MFSQLTEFTVSDDPGLRHTLQAISGPFRYTCPQHMKPKILLVDDHELVRKGIRQLLEGPTREICGEASSGEEALQKVAELQPDLIVMDYFLPGISGIETMQKIREISSAKILILTMDDAAIGSAKKLGADACVHKSAVVAELHQAIAKLLIGRKLADGW